MILKKWKQLIYFFDPLLPRKLPEGFLYERSERVKDHRKKEIKKIHIQISEEVIVIKTTIQTYEAGSVYEKINITHTTEKEEKHISKSQDTITFWKVLRDNKAAEFPSPDIHSSHDGMTDQFSSDNQIFISFYKEGLHRQYDIFDGHDYEQGNPWSARLQHILDAEEKLISQAERNDREGNLFASSESSASDSEEDGSSSKISGLY